MFDAFQQADSSISRRYGGTGLGLPIARTLAERMGGTLRAQSEEGRGSVFTLEIPLALYQQALPARVPARTDPQGGDGEGRNVLLVEDNPVNQTVIEAMLRSLGFTGQCCRRWRTGSAQCREPDLRGDTDGLPTAGHRRL